MNLVSFFGRWILTYLLLAAVYRGSRVALVTLLLLQAIANEFIALLFKWHQEARR